MEILNYRKIKNGSAILAEFSIKIPKWHLILHKVKHMKGKNGGEFVTGLGLILGLYAGGNVAAARFSGTGILPVDQDHGLEGRATEETK